MSTIVNKVQEIIKGSDDRLILFCQFDDLKAKVIEAHNDASSEAVSLEGTVKYTCHGVSVCQKDAPDPSDPRVLVLKMDDEQSAGLNLTRLNHAVFVHPLLACSLTEYDAYETQAIGRIRRYGQSKKVHVWRCYANHTVYMDIKAEFLDGRREARKCK